MQDVASSASIDAGKQCYDLPRYNYQLHQMHYALDRHGTGADRLTRDLGSIKVRRIWNESETSSSEAVLGTQFSFGSHGQF